MSEIEKNKREAYIERRNKDKRKRQYDDIKEIIKSPQGRRFIWRILKISDLYNNGFMENTNLMYYVSGKKVVGKEILDDVMFVEPNLFSRMQSEYYSELNSEKITENQYLKQDVAEGNAIDFKD